MSTPNKEYIKLFRIFWIGEYKILESYARCRVTQEV